MVWKFILLLMIRSTTLFYSALWAKIGGMRWSYVIIFWCTKRIILWRISIVRYWGGRLWSWRRAVWCVEVNRCIWWLIPLNRWLIKFPFDLFNPTLRPETHFIDRKSDAGSEDDGDTEESEESDDTDSDKSDSESEEEPPVEKSSTNNSIYGISLDLARNKAESASKSTSKSSQNRSGWVPWIRAKKTSIIQ